MMNKETVADSSDDNDDDDDDGLGVTGNGGGLPSEPFLLPKPESIFMPSDVDACGAKGVYSGDEEDDIDTPQFLLSSSIALPSS